MQIARTGGIWRVKIGMGIEPEDKKRAGLRLGPLRHAQNGAKRQAVIAAHKDREILIHGGLCQRLGPCNGFGQMVYGGVFMRHWQGRARGDISEIANAVAKACERFRQTRHAVGIRPHAAAKLAHTGIDRRADEGKGGGDHFKARFRFL